MASSSVQPLRTAVDAVVGEADAARPVRAGRIYPALARLEPVAARRLGIALALVLVAPSVWSGLALDDYVLVRQLASSAGSEWAGSAPFDLFRWFDLERDRRLIDGGGLPWWTFEGASLAFMRPISSLTHTLDHLLWPGSALMMHVHGLFWFALLLALAAKLYAELISVRWVLVAATLMYALDSTHGCVVGWISNRNALIGGAFAIAALLLHHRHRSQGQRGAALGAWLCFTLSLLSAELALGVVGYLAAYALCYERGRLLPRLRTLAPYALIAAGWASARKAFGYGSFGLDGYVDPVGEPAQFLATLPERAIVLLSSQVSRIAADLFDLAPADARALLVALGVVVCAATIWFVWPALRAERSLRFFACGAVLSIVPLSATTPGDRLLVLTGLGVMPVLAGAAHDALRARGFGWVGSAQARQRGAFAAGLIVLHLVIDPLLLPWTALGPSLVGDVTTWAERTLSAEPAIADKVVVVAAVPDSVMLTFLPVIRAVEGRPRPSGLYWLAATPSETRIERRDRNVLRVTAHAGFFDSRSEARSAGFVLHPGERIELAEFTVEIVELTPDGRPAVCDFIFAEPLESPRYLWRVWQGQGLTEFTVPALGQSVTVRTG